MGWQARLPKDQKPEFVRTCNKCGGTGFKKTFIAMDGQPLANPIRLKCVCVLRREEMEKLAKKAVEAMEKRKDENVEEWADKLASDVSHLND